jgi:hypothetical protein
MSKILNHLNKQLTTELKKDAEDCILIFNKLKEINNGSVWSSQWSLLIETKFQGFPSDNRTFKPSEIGYIFLKGI